MSRTKLEDVVLATACAFGLVRWVWMRSAHVVDESADLGDSARDGWGNRYELTCDWRGLHVHSAGEDHEAGTPDDLWSDR